MYVYILRAGNRGAIKIGMAINVEKRVKCLQTANAFELKVIGLIPCDSVMHALETESRIHRIFARQRIRGEWFQGNIDFKKISGIDAGMDTTKSSKKRKPSWN